MLMHVNVPLDTHVHLCGQEDLRYPAPSLSALFPESAASQAAPDSSYSRLPVIHVGYGYMAIPAS